VDSLFFADRKEVIREAITEGAVPDFVAYKQLRAKYEVWAEAEYVIRSLLKQEDKDE
jgi:hypothetical protein